jgi:hypothetical protein
MESIIEAMTTSNAETNCRIWNGTGASKGFPYFTLNDNYKEKHQFSIISLLVREKYKISIPSRIDYILCECHKACVNLDHLGLCVACAKHYNYYVESCPLFKDETCCAICQKKQKQILNTP